MSVEHVFFFFFAYVSTDATVGLSQDQALFVKLQTFHACRLVMLFFGPALHMDLFHFSPNKQVNINILK